MKDLHYEWIKKMFAECDILLWPWLQTKKMLSRHGVLAPYTKNLGRALSHCLLMQRLYDKAQITQGKALLWISEPGTSKTCSVCGAINGKLGGLGLFNCNPERGGCGNCVPRDWQGATNNLVAGVLQVHSQRCDSSLLLLRSRDSRVVARTHNRPEQPDRVLGDLWEAP